MLFCLRMKHFVNPVWSVLVLNVLLNFMSVTMEWPHNENWKKIKTNFYILSRNFSLTSNCWMWFIYFFSFRYQKQFWAVLKSWHKLTLNMQNILTCKQTFYTYPHTHTYAHLQKYLHPNTMKGWSERAFHRYGPTTHPTTPPSIKFVL